MNTLKKFFTIVSSLITIFSTTNKSDAVNAFLTNIGMKIQTFANPNKIFNVVKPTSTEKTSTTFQTGSINSVKTDITIVEKPKNKHQEISEAYRQLRELHKINCNLDELKNADVENSNQPISGITFYEKLYAYCNMQLDLPLQPTENFTSACLRMINFLCDDNKDIRYLIHMPSIVGSLLRNNDLFNGSRESQTFSIEFFDELWTSDFLCMTDNFNSSINLYNIKRYSNWGNVKDDSQKEYIMNLIICKTATLYEFILNKLYTTDYLLKKVVTSETNSYGFLVDSFIFKKRNEILSGMPVVIYNGFRDDIVNVWFLNLSRFLQKLRSASQQTVEKLSKKELKEWIELSQKIYKEIYKELGANEELQMSEIPVFCNTLLKIISQQPEFMKEKISSKWHQWLILSLFLSYNLKI